MSKEAMKLALEYVEYVPDDRYAVEHIDRDKLVTALREALAEQPAQQEPVAWTPINQPYPPGGELDILMGDGSILCEVLPQADGDLWWGGASTGERFIDPKYASVTHWRIHAEHTSPPAQQEPVVRWDSDGWGDLLVDSLPDGTLLYTSPPAQRTWVGLTQDEFRDFASTLDYGTGGLIRAIEAKLKEKNT